MIELVITIAVLAVGVSFAVPQFINHANAVAKADDIIAACESEKTEQKNNDKQCPKRRRANPAKLAVF